MVSGIIAILAALAVPLGIWLTWWVKNRHDPKTEIQKAKDENREAIANGTAGDLLRQRLNRVSGDKSFGPDNRPAAD
ncbi:MAG: hypothetical protein ACTHKU_07820 [Verrucomicrobiota bacterium]